MHDIGLYETPTEPQLEGVRKGRPAATALAAVERRLGGRAAPVPLSPNLRSTGTSPAEAFDEARTAPKQHLVALVSVLRRVVGLDAQLTNFDAGVAQLETVRSQLKQYRQSVLKTAFEGRLTADFRLRRGYGGQDGGQDGGQGRAEEPACPSAAELAAVRADPGVPAPPVRPHSRPGV